MGASADQAFAAGRFGQALALYEARAACGDAYSGEMAGYMLYFGPALFGSEVPCDRARARQWLAQAAQDGRLVAQMMVRRLDRCEAGPAFFNPTGPAAGQATPCTDPRRHTTPEFVNGGLRHEAH
jgi:hypothetical protein